MRTKIRAGALALLMILSMIAIAAPGATTVAVPTADSPVDTPTTVSTEPERPPGNNTTDHRTGKRNHWPNGSDHLTAQSISVTAIIETTGLTDARVAALRNRTAGVESTYRDTAQVRTVRTSFDSLRELPWVVSVRQAESANPLAVTSEGVEAINADRLHSLDVTGKNVTIGVIDVGYDVTHPEIRDNIAGSKSFTGDLTNGGDSDHGTAVAEIILDVAPNATLYVANVDTAIEFANAVAWLESQEVDVISVSLGYSRISRGGTFSASNAASEAAENGTLFVAAAGNSGAAATRWGGESIDADGDNWVDFTSGGVEANYLADGDAISGSVDIRLTWDGWPSTTVDYDLYLFDDSRNVIASSTVEQHPSDGAPFEWIAGTLPRKDRYFVAVRRIHDPEGHRFELSTGTAELRYHNGFGSISSPATGMNVTAVGAFRYDTDELEAFSSGGPTLDGRGGINLVGPNRVSTSVYGQESFVGTSAAAPHIAGVAALLLADNRSFRRADLVHIMESSATDIEQPGFDYPSGYGRANASLALQDANPHADEFSIAESNVSVNQTVSIETTLSNTVDHPGTESIALYVDGTREASRSVHLNGSETKSVSFDHAFSTNGTHTVRVSYLPTQEVNVLAAANGSENESAGSSNDSTQPLDVRTLSSSAVAPGGAITVTLGVTVTTSKIAFSEAVDPPVEAIKFEAVTVDGDPDSPFASLVLESGLVVAIDGLQNGSNVTVRYSLDVSENASLGSTYTLSGEVTDEDTRVIENDTLTVEPGSSLSGAAGAADLDNDGRITDAELSIAIADWAAGDYSDANLSVIISAWAAT